MTVGWIILVRRNGKIYIEAIVDTFSSITLPQTMFKVKFFHMSLCLPLKQEMIGEEQVCGKSVTIWCCIALLDVMLH